MVDDRFLRTLSLQKIG